MEGTKVRIIGTPEGCCGVLQLHWTGVVKEYIFDNERPTIVVLKDNSLHWESDLEVINDERKDMGPSTSYSRRLQIQG